VVAAEAAEPKVAVILTRQRVASRACGRWWGYGVTIRGAGAWPRWAVAIMASKIAQPEVVPRSGPSIASSRWSTP
jgi:hypothetical protein